MNKELKIARFDSVRRSINSNDLFVICKSDFFTIQCQWRLCLLEVLMYCYSGPPTTILAPCPGNFLGLSVDREIIFIA